MPRLCKVFVDTLQNRDRLKQYRKAVKRAVCNLNTIKKAGLLQRTTQDTPSTYSGPAPDYIGYSDSESTGEFNESSNTSSSSEGSYTIFSSTEDSAPYFSNTPSCSSEEEDHKPKRRFHSPPPFYYITSDSDHTTESLSILCSQDSESSDSNPDLICLDFKIFGLVLQCLNLFCVFEFRTVFFYIIC